MSRVKDNRWPDTVCGVIKQSDAVYASLVGIVMTKVMTRGYTFLKSG